MVKSSLANRISAVCTRYSLEMEFKHMVDDVDNLQRSLSLTPHAIKST